MHTQYCHNDCLAPFMIMFPNYQAKVEFFKIIILTLIKCAWDLHFTKK